MKRKKTFTVAVTLICSVTLIAVSYWHVNRSEKDARAGKDDAQKHMTEKLDAVRGVTASDHVLGNPDASIVFYVYSDFACPYCREYHETLRTLLNIYGDTGEVAYVFRHLPFVEIHPNAPMYALASECVAKEGGQRAFWIFTDNLFDGIDPANPLTAEGLVVMASNAGVNSQQFVSCMRSNTLMKDVETDYEEAVAVGADGTPFTVVQTPEMRSTYSGAQSLKTLAYVLTATIGSGGTRTNSNTIRFEDFDQFTNNSIATTSSQSGTSTQNTKATTTEQSVPLDGAIQESPSTGLH